jgi:hypothetical protein
MNDETGAAEFPPRPAGVPISHEARNAIILRRTLSAVSWLYALFNGGMGLLLWPVGPVARLMVAHGALQALAGTMLWKPRRGAVPAALLAAAGSIFFVILDFRRQNPQAALIDAVYPLAALILLVKSRHRA